MQKNCYLFTKKNIPLKARFPVVDAHNHLWGGFDKMNEMVEIMNEVGVISYCDLTSNATVTWEGGGYSLGSNDLDKFLQTIKAYPKGKFYGFTTVTFNKPISKPLYSDPKAFVETTIDLLREHAGKGIKGLKILKELGLHYREKNGKLIHLDDEILAPIWEEAGHLGMPVLIHQSDPFGFFQPLTPENEHYDTLKKFPDWNFSDPKFPSKNDLLMRRDNVVKNHPHTIFMLPHVANFAENLDNVSELLDNNKNVYIDFSARIDELGRQPYTSREFMIAYQDRIYFGTDMPVSRDMYRCYFRFLETYDEYFIPPDYDGTFDRFRWHIYGLGLPDEVLKKLYYQNILKIIPSLSNELGIL